MIRYSVEKSNFTNSWIIWKNVEDERSCGCHPIYRGRSKRECYKKLKEIRDHKYKVNIQRDVIEKEYYFNKENKNENNNI